MAESVKEIRAGAGDKVANVKIEKEALKPAVKLATRSNPVGAHQTWNGK